MEIAQIEATDPLIQNLCHTNSDSIRKKPPVLKRANTEKQLRVLPHLKPTSGDKECDGTVEPDFILKKQAVKHRQNGTVAPNDNNSDFYALSSDFMRNVVSTKTFNRLLGAPRRSDDLTNSALNQLSQQNHVVINEMAESSNGPNKSANHGLSYKHSLQITSDPLATNRLSANEAENSTDGGNRLLRAIRRSCDFGSSLATDLFHGSRTSLASLRVGESFSNLTGTGGRQRRSDASNSDKSVAKLNSVPPDKRKLNKFAYRSQLTLREAKIGLSIRKNLLAKRTSVADLSLVLALAGIFLMILDDEMTGAEIIQRKHWISQLIRSTIVLSTLALECSIIWYHVIEVKLVMIDAGAEDWRVAIATSQMIQIGQELLICGLCPVPGTQLVNWTWLDAENHGHVSMKITTEIPLDVLLSLPMFLRLYLLCRCMVLHSHLFTDAATRSIAVMNHVNVDFWFVVKTLMRDKPLKCLLTITLMHVVIISWLFVQCERFSPHSRNSPIDLTFMNSLWLIMITFLSVGYGDTVPSTYCGRALCVFTGIVGVGMMAAVVAIISRLLNLTKAEKHVNAFMADSKLHRMRHNAAASVLQHTWFMYKYRVKCPSDNVLRSHQRKFLSSINNFRKVKWDQLKLGEQNDRLVDAERVNIALRGKMSDLQKTQDQILTECENASTRLNSLETMIRHLMQSNRWRSPPGQLAEIDGAQNTPNTLNCPPATQ